MAEPTVPQVFGPNATQTTTQLTITKEDLTAVGLTVADTVPADKLFGALFLLARNYYTQANQEANEDQSIRISDSFTNFTTVGNNSYREFAYTVFVRVPDTQSLFDPDVL